MSASLMAYPVIEWSRWIRARSSGASTEVKLPPIETVRGLGSRYAEKNLLASRG